jgi:hypothetical protein
MVTKTPFRAAAPTTCGIWSGQDQSLVPDPSQTPSSSAAIVGELLLLMRHYRPRHCARLARYRLPQPLQHAVGCRSASSANAPAIRSGLHRMLSGSRASLETASAVVADLDRNCSYATSRCANLRDFGARRSCTWRPAAFAANPAHVLVRSDARVRIVHYLGAVKQRRGRFGALTCPPGRACVSAPSAPSAQPRDHIDDPFASMLLE